MKPYMTCREIIEFLDDYVAGEQPDAVRAEFERHLAACPPCVHYLAGYRTTVELARAAKAEEDASPCQVPEELIRAILAARRKAGP